MEDFHQYIDFMNRLLSGERFKWIFLIRFLGVVAGFTPKNVISYPDECMTTEMVTLR